MFRFAAEYFLWSIPLILLLFIFTRKESAIKFSGVELIKKSGAKKSIRYKFGKYFILVGIILLIIGLARPQMVDTKEKSEKNGVDIMVSLDVSQTMQINDFQPSRLEAAKSVIKKFVDMRKDDRIGLVIFSGTSYTKIPLTIDYNIIKETVSTVSLEDVSKDGTAIGMGIATAVNRLKNSEAKSKVIILLTDGDNNTGIISPETAANLAKDSGIKIYTIGVGSNRVYMGTNLSGDLNEDLLKSMAQETGGTYFRADSENALKDIFDKINSLEKTKINTNNYYSYTELFYNLVIVGLLLVALGLLWEEFLFVRIP